MLLQPNGGWFAVARAGRSRAGTHDGCKEIHHFLIDPTYRGHEHYPVYNRIDPDWKLGPEDFE